MKEKLGKCGLCDKEATHPAGGYIFSGGATGILDKPLCDEHFQEFVDA